MIILKQAIREIKKIPIKQLKVAEYNPRKDLQPGDTEYEKIKKSIEEFGYVDFVIVNNDMTVIGGHQRLKILKDLGYTEIECIVLDLSKTKEKMLNISLNQNKGKWDYSKLNALIYELSILDINIDSIGFSNEEIQDMISDLDVTDDDFLKDTEIVREKEKKVCPNCGCELI